MDVCLCVSVLCCPVPVEAFATGWSLVQRSPTKCLKQITKPPVSRGQGPYNDCRTTDNDDYIIAIYYLLITITLVIEDSKAPLWCSKFPWTREGISSKIIDNLVKRSEEGSPVLVYIGSHRTDSVKVGRGTPMCQGEEQQVFVISKESESRADNPYEISYCYRILLPILNCSILN
jgi:hypothetical protein